MTASQRQAPRRPLLTRWKAIAAAIFGAPLAAPLSMLMGYVVAAPLLLDPQDVRVADVQYLPFAIAGMYAAAFLPCLVAGGIMMAASGAWPFLRPVWAWSGVGALLGTLPGLAIALIGGMPNPIAIGIGACLGAACATAYRLIYGLSHPWDARSFVDS